MTDTGGTGACPATQIGEYTYTCGGGTLTFEQVSDECMGRSNFFGCEWSQR